jgi:hypothetical protein
MWNLAKSTLPDFIINDIEGYVKTMPPLDNMKEYVPNETDGTYSRTGALDMSWAKVPVEFAKANLAPPCLHVATNYSRFGVQ